MMSWRIRPVVGAAVAVAAALAIGATSGFAAEDQLPPASAEEPAAADAPAATDTAGTAAETPAPSAETPAPVEPQPPAAAAESGEASVIDASQLKIGTAVYGADGAKIGEINRVTSNNAGKVEQIYVTAGGQAGLNAKVFAVAGSKITEVGNGVKLSLTSEEAKQLPIIDNSNG
jgi:hypothetical protein